MRSTRLPAALKEAGAKRCMALKVSGPFHSAMLEEAGEKLAKELEHVTIHDIATPYITNVTADYVTDKSQVKELLKQADFLFCTLAAECGAHDCGSEWKFLLKIGPPRKSPDRIFKEDR